MGRDQVSGGVSVPCQHATPVANDLWKPLEKNIKTPVPLHTEPAEKGLILHCSFGSIF